MNCYLQSWDGEQIKKEGKKGIPGYMNDVLETTLELFVRVQRLEERLEKLEKKPSQLNLDRATDYGSVG